MVRGDRARFEGIRRCRMTTFRIGDEKELDDDIPADSIKLWHTHEVYGFAQSCARHALEKCGIPPHAVYEDCVQEVAIALLRCEGKSRQYAWTSGYRAALEWIHSFLYGDKSRRRTEFYPQHVELNEYAVANHSQEIDFEDGDELSVSEDVANLIAQIMLASRKQQRGRAVTAAYRDANIIMLSLQGFSVENIAEILECDVQNIRIYRRRARQAISQYLRRKKGGDSLEN